MKFSYEKQRKILALQETISEYKDSESNNPSTFKNFTGVVPSMSFTSRQDQRNKQDLLNNKPRFNHDDHIVTANVGHDSMRSSKVNNDRAKYSAPASFDDDMLDAAMMEIDTDG